MIEENLTYLQNLPHEKRFIEYLGLEIDFFCLISHQWFQYWLGVSWINVTQPRKQVVLTQMVNLPMNIQCYYPFKMDRSKISVQENVLGTQEKELSYYSTYIGIYNW